ncbi:rhomboid family intramembrane serine protease [Fructilactobacillus carniphilus]|uniref:Rhomboid family intramembrane serine protease n=1 Tax=Fructilactobacillus carniphilus TaxID=2940297 RepID=A0ABY5BXC8_9LACO|nr:rhomboid family intramembrane serine protease [Fructilactobacillus carniphilus]USS91160.1 rhomboid family intramembrane serine protease [Fructilactobacillus carniphilus]
MSKLRNQPIVTWTLIVVMTLVFIAMTFAGGTTNLTTLVQFGGEVNQLVRAGEWWRLITPIFIHIGWQHLTLNLLTLYFLGRILEGIFGHWRFLVLFLGSGIVGNLFSFAFGSDGSVSAGCSTSLFGLFGAFLMLGITLPQNQWFKQTAQSFLLLIIINLVSDLFLPTIDIWGHVGGLVGGFCGSFTIGLPQSKLLTKKVRFIYANVLIIVIITLWIIGFNH